MARLEIPTLDEETESRLLEEARRRNLSPEVLAARLLREGLGLEPTVHYDLDHLAGTWTQTEVEAFKRAVAPFAEVDEALWRAENPA